MLEAEICLRSLLVIEVCDTGKWFPAILLIGSSFLKISETYAVFQSSGILPKRNNIWNNLVISRVMTALICFRNIAFIWAGSQALSLSTVVLNSRDRPGNLWLP